MAWDADGGANAFDAIKEAINFYMGLRADKFDRQRQTLADSRAARALDLQEQQHELNMQEHEAQKSQFSQQQGLAEDRLTDEGIRFQMQNSGGNILPEQDVSTWSRRGYGSALEDEQTLPSFRPSLPVTMPQGNPGMTRASGDIVPPEPSMPSPMNTIAEQIGPQATGRQRIAVPESEKMRIAMLNAASREGIAGQTNRTRLTINSDNVAAKLRQIESMAQTAEGRRILGYYIADVNDVSQRMSLAQRATEAEALAGDRSYDNLFNGGPLRSLEYLQQGFPSPPPSYYQAPLPNQPPPATGRARDLGQLQ